MHLLENEVVTENVNNNESVDEVNNQYHEELLKNQVKSIVENASDENEISFSQEAIAKPLVIPNDLKEFGVDIDEPDLFSSDDHASNSDDLIGLSDEKDEEDELEIPAFFKKTKKLMVFRKNKWETTGIGCSKTLSGIAR